MLKPGHRHFNQDILKSSDKLFFFFLFSSLLKLDSIPTLYATAISSPPLSPLHSASTSTIAAKLQTLSSSLPLSFAIHSSSHHIQNGCAHRIAVQ